MFFASAIVKPPVATLHISAREVVAATWKIISPPAPAAVEPAPPTPPDMVIAPPAPPVLVPPLSDTTDRERRLLHGHFDYLLSELDCTAQEPPQTPEGTTEYLRGLHAYIQTLKTLLPELEPQEEEVEEYYATTL